jgi:putative peptidoglycan lipid II flippase
LILLRVPITKVLFQHGKFMAESTALTAHALLYYSLGLPAFAAIKLITPMYYSTHDTMTPTRVGIYSLGLHVALNVILLFAFSGYLWNASPALASSLAAYFNFALLFYIFRGRYGRLGARAIVASIAKMGICAVVMAGACFVALRFSGFASLERVLSQAGLLAAMIIGSVAIYFGLAWILRCEELPELFLMLRRAGTGAVSAGGIEV